TRTGSSETRATSTRSDGPDGGKQFADGGGRFGRSQPAARSAQPPLRAPAPFARKPSSSSARRPRPQDRTGPIWTRGADRLHLEELRGPPHAKPRLPNALVRRRLPKLTLQRRNRSINRAFTPERELIDGVPGSNTKGDTRGRR